LGVIPAAWFKSLDSDILHKEEELKGQDFAWGWVFDLHLPTTQEI
jgi:hypothetical protein